MESTRLLQIIALAIAVLQTGVVLALVVRNWWVEFTLKRRAQNSRLLAGMLNSFGADRSAHARGEISRRQLQQDMRALEHWLDLMVERGEDPGWLPPEEYERTGLIDRYLTELKTSRKWARRAAAAEILGWTGSPRVVPALLETALDVVGEAENVRTVALRSLARIRHPDAVEPLVKSLSTADTWFAPTAAAVLARIGAPAVEPLRHELEDTDRPVVSRRWAASILGDIGDRRALGGLHAALADVDPELRSRAAKALGKIRDASSIGPLLDRLLTDPSPFVRTNVAKSLGRLPTRETIDFLTQSLSDPEWWVRLRAVESLANLGTPAIDALRGALHDRDPVVAREAARGLEQLGVVADSIRAIGGDAYSPEHTEFLIQVGRAGSLDGLLEALARPEPGIVREMTRVLSRIGNSAAGAPLAALIGKTDDDDLKARAVDALAKVGAKGFVAEVLPCLGSRHPWLRRSSLVYLEKFARPQELAGLRELLSSSSSVQRKVALTLLRAVRPESITEEEIALFLLDPEVEVRAEAAAFLAHAGRCDLLLSHPTLDQDDAVVREVIRHLVPTSDISAVRVILLLLTRATDRDLDRLSNILVSVAREHPRETMLLLMTDTRDPAVRWAIATVALVVPGPLPVPIFTLSEDADPRVRGAALPALHFLSDDPMAARDKIVAATRDRSSLVSRRAVQALALVPDASVDLHFEAVLRSSEPRVVADVILALAIRRRLTREHLEIAAHLRDDVRVRLASLAGLTLQGDLNALRGWLAALRDPKESEVITRWRAGESPLFGLLVQFAQDDKAPLESRLLAAESSHVAEMRLIEELESNPSEEVRLLAAQGIEGLASRKADGVLLSACLRDPSPRVRSASLAYLVERAGDLQRMGLLESALKDPEEVVRCAAARRTSLLADSEAIPILVRHLGTGNSRFFDAVVEALAERAVRNSEMVLRAIRALPETQRVAVGTVAILQRSGISVPFDVAEPLFEHRWAPVRAAALQSLAWRTGAKAVPLVLAACGDPSAEVRYAALRTLKHDAIDFHPAEMEREAAIARLLYDPSVRVRRRAVLLAGALHLKRTLPAVRRLTKDADPKISRTAKRVLGRLEKTPAESVEVLP